MKGFSLPLCLAAGLALAGVALAHAGDGAAVTPPPGTVAGVVWHLPGSPETMRVTGEDGTLAWPVFVPAAAFRSMKLFQLGYQSAVSVMPEASWITLRVNGQTVGRVPITASGATKVLSFDIAPGTLSSGWNAVEVEISQRHRVDCSIAATYELWTQIDPARTGFVGDAPKMTGLDDLPALSTDASGTARLHLILPKDPSPAEFARALKVVDRVVLWGRFLHPVIDTAPASSGLQIAVGTTAALGAAVEGMIKRSNASAQMVVAPEGAPMLVVSGPTEEALDTAIEELGSHAAEPRGTAEGLQALAVRRGARLAPGGALTFAELGIRSRTFGGRLFRESFDVVLPPDAYLADYGEARLSLDGGYAPGLTSDARLAIRVNGIVDGNLNLDHAGGAVFQGEIIHMPLEAFRPGRNHIEIEALLPAVSDESCDTLASINAKERLLILGTSTLSLPTLARIAQFPSLSATFAGGFRVTPAVPPRLFLPRMSPGALAAAATLMANATLSTGVPTDAAVLHSPPQGGDDPAVVVGVASDLPASALAAAGIDARSLAMAWPAGMPRQQASIASKASMASRRSGQNGSDSDRLEAWGQGVERFDGWLGRFGSAGAWFGTVIAATMHSAGLISDPDRLLALTPQTSFLIAQGLDGGMPLTLVTAPDDMTLATGAAAVTEPARFAALEGRAASLDDADAGTNLTPAQNQSFFRTRRFSIANDRLVAAGWLSSHAGWYIGAAVLLALLLGTSTWAALSLSREEG